MHYSEKPQAAYQHHRWGQQYVSHVPQATGKLYTKFDNSSLFMASGKVGLECSNTIVSKGKKTYGVILASPVGQRTPGWTSGTFRHASKSSGPAALCMADTIIELSEKKRKKTNQ